MTDQQFADTVNWAGDGDDDDFFSTIERIFDLKLRRELPWTTFGDVLDHVDAYVQKHGPGDGCATQMAFYRLRAALGLGRSVRPEEQLEPHLHGRLKWQFRDLEADTGLDLPSPALGPKGWLAVAMFGAALVAAFLMESAMMRVGVVAVLAIGGYLLKVADHRRLPAGLTTLGDLARVVADRNRGKLAKEGARLTRDEIWRIIQELAALESGIDPERVRPGTTFFKSTIKTAA